MGDRRPPREARHRAAAVAAATLLASALLASCPSRYPIRGTVVQNTQRPPARRAAASHPSCRGDAVDDVWLAIPGFCVTRFADELERPRHLAFAPDGDLYVATRAGIMVLWDGDGDGVAGPRERARLGGRDLSNHGIAFAPDGRHVYYASGGAVLRLPYAPRQRAFTGVGEVVIRDLPHTPRHPYKSITFDREGRLYVQVGAPWNRVSGTGAVIMRYVIPEPLPAGGLAYASGEQFARGLRNALALAWDREGRLWAVDNGLDYLRPHGTPEDFYRDHPGEPIYRLSPEPGTFYGYPYCWLLGPVPWGARTDPLSRWADPEVAAEAGRDDAWCQDGRNVWPAAGALFPHTAPLGAVQYTGELFPPEYRGDLFVTSHGSWNRHGAQVGRVLLRVRVAGDRVAAVEPLLGERADGGDRREGRWIERPTGIAQGPDGALYVTSDETGHVFRVGFARE